MNQINVKRMSESAVLLALAMVLSLLSINGFWALGGSVTLGSMVPLVIVSHRYGPKWGIAVSVVYGFLQMILGIQNVQYATSFLMAVGIIFLDYVLAFGVMGFSSAFRRVIKNQRLAIIVGVFVCCMARLCCHFLSGWIIWEALWPNEMGMASMLWSLYYNSSYMIPETIITCIAAVILVPVAEKIE